MPPGPKHMGICVSFMLGQGTLEYFAADNMYIQAKVNSSPGWAKVEGRFVSFLEPDCTE